MSEQKEQEIFALMEREDETQIAQELRGQFIDKMVYSFQQGNNTIVGLSWVGVKEVARRMGGITILDVQIQETPEHFTVVCKARDEARKLEMSGVSRQMKIAKWGEDQFALQKAMSKAQRNAIRSLIPETLIATCIDEFRKKGSEKVVDPFKSEAKP